MHSVNNQDDYWTEMFPVAARAVYSSKMLFETRQTSENSKCSLRYELEIGLIMKKNHKFSPFRSDKGQRMVT